MSNYIDLAPYIKELENLLNKLNASPEDTARIKQLLDVIGDD